MTASPLDNWSKTAPMSDVGARDELVPFAGIGGGGGAPSRVGIGGGGGGGGPEDAEDVGAAPKARVSPACTWRSASCGSIPSLLFQVTPDG